MTFHKEALDSPWILKYLAFEGDLELLKGLKHISDILLRTIETPNGSNHP